MASGNGTGNSQAPSGKDEQQSTEDRGLVGRVGPLEIDVPKALGYYGGITVALAAGLIEPPIALFIAAVPLFKMLNRPNSSQAEWMAGQVLDGAATPVGGSGSPVIRVSNRTQRPGGARWGRVFAPYTTSG